ncbi:MAG: hypothetical protein J0H11_13655 [Rhizobiales bacterium]|nr:hypothetical protein [Hyphomicrobiales bacterium]
MQAHFSDRPSRARSFELVETTSLRGRMERAIEALIAALDALDGDADTELDACDDEETHDREAVCEDEGAQCDDEGDLDYGVADKDALSEQAGCFTYGWAI